MKCTADAGNAGLDLRDYCKTLTLRAHAARDSRDGYFLSAIYRVIANGGTIVVRPNGGDETTMIFPGCGNADPCSSSG